MFSNILVIFLLIRNIFTVDFCSKKPNYIKTCEFSDPEFVKCSTDSIQTAFDEIVKGIAGIEEKIGTIDPMKMNEINILQGSDKDLISVNIGLSDVTIYGLKNLKILESRVSSEDFSWETRIGLPTVRVEANYHGQAKIIIITVKGQGSCWFEPSDMEFTMSTKTNLYQKDGHIFYNITDVKLDYTIENFKLQMDNLFGGAKDLEDSANKYFNQNWRLVEEILNPILRKIMAGILLDIMQKVFHEIPAEYFVKDLPADRAFNSDYPIDTLY